MAKTAFLIDINGVLYVKGEPVPGAAETLDFLRDNGHPFRLISNATQKSRKSMLRKLKCMGFDLSPGELCTAPMAAIRFMQKKNKGGCFLLSTGDVHRDFRSAGIRITRKDPDYVVIGDAAENFTYENMNRAFNLVLNGAGILAMEKDHYWMSQNGLALNAGPYVAALEYATGKTATVVGKPSKEFFMSALKDMKSTPRNTWVIGDDLCADIGGAHANGMKGILVETGKYRKRDIPKIMKSRGLRHPDRVLPSIAALIPELKVKGL